MRKLLVILLLVFSIAPLALGFAPLAHAASDDWPNRPVHFVVLYPAGGSTDVAARVIADYLSRTFGHRIVVENRAGANGNIGMQYVSQSAPDGYTILVGTDAVSSNLHVYKMDFDPLQTLVPIIELSRQPIALAVHTSLGISSLNQLTELVKKEPGMSFATGSGAASMQAMVALWYAKLAGINLVQVPYRGGGEAINDLIGGQVKLGSFGSTPLIPQYKAGLINILAQSMASRSSALPDVPTFAEAGFPDLVVDQRLGLFAPKGTPSEIIARLNTEVNAALHDEKVRKALADQAQEPAGGSPEQYAKLVIEDSEKDGRLARELNVKAE
jgi:tripartite-type tricarboxylate transporter receptor subunit TctC